MTLGVGLTIGKALIQTIAAGWGGGGIKNHIGEQAGAYAEILESRLDEGVSHLPERKAAIFREKFPEAAEFLEIAMERDEGLTYLVVFLRMVEARFDKPD